MDTTQEIKSLIDQVDKVSEIEEIQGNFLKKAHELLDRDISKAKAFIEKAESRKQEIEKLNGQLHELSTWTGFDDVDEELIPFELDIALQVYMSGIKAYDPKTGKMDNDQPIKKWLGHKVNDFFDGDPSAALCERIATVANWQKGGGRPGKGNK